MNDDDSKTDADDHRSKKQRVVGEFSASAIKPTKADVVFGTQPMRWLSVALRYKCKAISSQVVKLIGEFWRPFGDSKENIVFAKYKCDQMRRGFRSIDLQIVDQWICHSPNSLVVERAVSAGVLSADLSFGLTGVHEYSLPHKANVPQDADEPEQPSLTISEELRDFASASNSIKDKCTEKSKPHEVLYSRRLLAERKATKPRKPDLSAFAKSRFWKQLIQESDDWTWARGSELFAPFLRSERGSYTVAEFLPRELRQKKRSPDDNPNLSILEDSGHLWMIPPGEEPIKGDATVIWVVAVNSDEFWALFRQLRSVAEVTLMCYRKERRGWSYRGSNISTGCAEDSLFTLVPADDVLIQTSQPNTFAETYTRITPLEYFRGYPSEPMEEHHKLIAMPKL